MSTSSEFWITIGAVIISPLLAVQIQRWLDASREKRNRREEVFHTLMATRAAKLSAEHVSSLNRIDIEWFGSRIFGIHRRSRAENEVIDSWKQYLDHLNTPMESMGGLQVWSAKGDELFTDLLYVISKSLGYNFDKVTLKRGVYSPVGHGTLFLEQEQIRKGCAEWLNGSRAVKVQFSEGPKT